MATTIIESTGDEAELTRGDSMLVTRLDNALQVLEQKQQEFAAYLEELKSREDEIKELRGKLIEVMDERGVTKLENDHLVISAVHPKASQRIDTKLLKTLNPRLFEQAFGVAGKTVETSPYVKITVKKK